MSCLRLGPAPSHSLPVPASFRFLVHTTYLRAAREASSLPEELLETHSCLAKCGRALAASLNTPQRAEVGCEWATRPRPPLWVLCTTLVGGETRLLEDAHDPEGHHVHQDLCRGSTLSHHGLQPAQVFRGVWGDRGSGGHHGQADGQVPRIRICKSKGRGCVCPMPLKGERNDSSLDNGNGGGRGHS